MRARLTCEGHADFWTAAGNPAWRSGSNRNAAPLEINYGSPIGDSVFPAPVARGYLNNVVVYGIVYATGAFVKDGDKFRIYDTREDGHRVALDWRLVDGARRGLCIDKDGFKWGPEECNKDLPENNGKYIRVGRYDGSVTACVTLGDYTDWSDWLCTRTS